MNPCPIDRLGGTLRPGSTTYTATTTTGVVVVRDVPAEVCDRCGTEIIADEVAAQLERLVEHAAEMDVAVADYRQVVA